VSLAPRKTPPAEEAAPNSPDLLPAEARLLRKLLSGGTMVLERAGSQRGFSRLRSNGSVWELDEEEAELVSALRGPRAADETRRAVLEGRGNVPRDDAERPLPRVPRTVDVTDAGHGVVVEDVEGPLGTVPVVGVEARPPLRAPLEPEEV
jgi:hypothetical protein